MRVTIFNDKQNFDGSLNLLNNYFKKGEKRFWNYEKYIPFLIDKLKSFDKLDKTDLQLTKTFFYSGKYSSKLINSFRWSCNQKIKELNLLIKKENDILNYISQQDIPHEVKNRTRRHVEDIIKKIQENRSNYLHAIEKQKRNYLGQKELFEEIKKNPFIEMRTTPLKQSGGQIYQKGVDVMIAADLINLAHTNSYDVALILGGDTDLIECVKLIKSLGKIVIISAFHIPGKPLLSTISDLIGAADYFLNLNNFSEKELIAMSDPLSK